MRIRAAKGGDTARLHELETLCFSAPWSEAAFTDELQNERAVYRVIECAGEVIAYAGMWVILDEAHVTNVAVHPEHRQKGLGEVLMRELMSVAAGEGAFSMTLEVRPSNVKALRLYEKLGFELAGRRKRYYHDGEDALLLWNQDIHTPSPRIEKRV